MTNRIFVVSDTHFGHKNIMAYEKKARPFSTMEEHDEALVSNWNAMVTPEDTVWHLGDVLFGDNFEPLSRLNGRKNLVMGNHDNKPMAEYLKYFDRIIGSYKTRDYLLTHMPIEAGEHRHHLGNIHGHLHSRCLDNPWYINVSVENTGFAPILLDTVIHRHQQLLQSIALQPPPDEAPDYRINNRHNVVVSELVHWKPVDDRTPRGCKLQLLGEGGVAVYGHYHGEAFWTHWSPVPQRPIDRKEALLSTANNSTTGH